MAASPNGDEFAKIYGFRVDITGPGGTEHDFTWDTFWEGLLSVGGDEFHTTTPGHKSIEEITLRGAMTDKRAALCTWINETVNGKPWRRTVTITELLPGADGSVKDGKQFIYHDCFPTGYVFPDLGGRPSGARGESEDAGVASGEGTFTEELRFGYARREVIEPL